MKLKENKIKYLHVAIIVLGIIFISIPIFHNNLWFDESYSVGMVNKSFTDIWSIGGKDVHPVLYYWILHLVYLIFGSNIYIYRFVSMIPIAILGILGYTHIRKDFGEKVGILFSFFVYFLPISCVYSGEIRMYTWAMFLVSVMSIYAYRIYKNPSNKNWIIFAIFSLASAYTHYYGLATAGIVNVMLLVYLIRKAIKEHKTNKENKIYTADLKKFTISAVLQVGIYLPWLICLVSQIGGVSKGFWIQEPSISLLLQIFGFQFTGNLDVLFINQTVALIFGAILLAYTIYCIINRRKKDEIEERKKENAGKFAIAVYLIVVAAIYVISIKMPILYARYFLNLTGLFMFFMAFYMAKGGKKVLTIIACALTLVTGIWVNINVTKMNYDQSNKLPLEYVKQDVMQDDLIIYGNEGSGFAISMQIPEIANCFYDGEHWNVEPAYKAFGKNMLYINTLDALDDYEGRIWIINSENFAIYNEFVERYKENVNMIKQESFSTGYHGYKYTITLIEKH